MISSKISYDRHPILKDKDQEFKTIINDFIVELQALSPEQKQKLGLFKAIELTNAVVQTLERDKASESLGETKALALFNIVRAAIRTRIICLPDNTIISLKDAAIKKLIDRACVMFHAGKNDPKQKEKSVAFSMAQNIVLDTEIQQGLNDFYHFYPEFYSREIVNIVRDKYLNHFSQNT